VGAPVSIVVFIVVAFNVVVFNVVAFIIVLTDGKQPLAADFLSCRHCW
jgi:hypothetical protein